MGLFRTAAKVGIAKRIYTEVRKQMDKRQGTSSTSSRRSARRPARRRTAGRRRT